jgi:uncharacterized protein YfaA (DUF2138 family)
MTYLRRIFKRGLVGILLILLLAGAFAWYRLHRFTILPPPGPAPAYLPLNLARPDALIVTQSLSQLPRDVLKVPLLKELLNEDFVFYYEHSLERIRLTGTVRRIAYEHDLNFGDELLAYAFATPAHLALWKGPDGSLQHYLLLIDRSGLVKALETLGKIVADDKQLKLRDAITLADGEKLPVYELEYGYQRSLFFADYHGSLLVFSGAGLLLPANPEQIATVAQFLAQPRLEALFTERFKLDGPAPTHQLAVAAEYLSFGYQRFFPALEALHFDFGPTGWSSAAWLTAALPPAEEVWKAVPTGAAMCIAAPVHPATVTTLIGQLLPGEPGTQLLAALESPAALCWYRRSRLYTPLMLIKTRRSDLTPQLRALFAQATGSPEAAIPAPAPTATDAAAATPVARSPAPPRKTYHPPFAVTEQPCSGGMIWRREVSSRYGLHPAKASPNAEAMRSSRFFAVTLAYCDQTLIFSPDDALAQQAVAVLAKQYPALADALPSGLDPVALIFPRSLAELLETELQESLPEAQEPVFRASVARYLLPQLEKSKQFPAQALDLPSGATGWVPIRWSALAAP